MKAEVKTAEVNCPVRALAIEKLHLTEDSVLHTPETQSDLRIAKTEPHPEVASPFVCHIIC